MVRFARRCDIKSEINIVPLLDVLLVLVLIFMATAPILTQSVEVSLPESSQSTKITNNLRLPVILEVSGIDKYAVVVNNHRMEQLPGEQVVAEIRKQLQADPKAIFLVGGDKNVPYNEVIKALNLLHQAGVSSVGLMTQPI